MFGRRSSRGEGRSPSIGTDATNERFAAINETAAGWLKRCGDRGWYGLRSPLSDTTILSSLATGSDLMDHVYTQIPLALTAAALGAVLYTVLAAFVV